MDVNLLSFNNVTSNVGIILSHVLNFLIFNLNIGFIIKFTG
jgi:hypothetical protein